MNIDQAKCLELLEKAETALNDLREFIETNKSVSEISPREAKIVSTTEFLERILEKDSLFVDVTIIGRTPYTTGWQISQMNKLPLSYYKNMKRDDKRKLVEEMITSEYALLEFSTQANFYSNVPLNVSWGQEPVTLRFNKSGHECDAMCAIRSYPAHQFENGLIGPVTKENPPNLWTLSATFVI
jgi:hypothetical protein